MQKTRCFFRGFVLVVAVVTLCFSIYKLYDIFSEYKENTDEYQEIIEEVVILPEEPVDEKESGNNEENIETTPIDYTKITIDFEKLNKTNKDTVAWIKFQNPSIIDYPVVQGNDNNKYLGVSFQGRKNFAGTLFVDIQSEGDFSGKNTFIHGHNMKNGSMFGSLRKYKTKSFCDSNPYFYVYTPDGNVSTYQVFAASVVDTNSKSYTKNYDSNESFIEYINYIKSKSLYKTSVEVTPESQIISLSTCTGSGDTQRLLVHGVKIAETQKQEKEN